MDNIKENQIGCGYCVYEFVCSKRESKVNKAKLGCKDYIHFNDTEKLKELNNKSRK